MFPPLVLHEMSGYLTRQSIVKWSDICFIVFMFDPGVIVATGVAFSKLAFFRFSPLFLFLSDGFFDTFLLPSSDVWHSFVDDGAIYWGPSFVFLQHGRVGTSF
jgi:hypothetical protein